MAKISYLKHFKSAVNAVRPRLLGDAFSFEKKRDFKHSNILNSLESFYLNYAQIHVSTSPQTFLDC